MPCEQTILLQKLLVESPHSLDTPGWNYHIQHCPQCEKEQHLYTKSLESYQLLTQAMDHKYETIDIWPELKLKLQQPQTPKKNQNLRRHLAIAASLLLLLGLGSWLGLSQQSTKWFQEKNHTATIEAKAQFVTDTGNTQIAWTSKRYLVQLDRHGHTYPSISVNVNLIPSHASKGLSEDPHTSKPTPSGESI